MDKQIVERWIQNFFEMDITLPETNIAMENPQFWWYLPGKMGFSWAMLVSGRVTVLLGMIRCCKMVCRRTIKVDDLRCLSSGHFPREILMCWAQREIEYIGFFHRHHQHHHNNNKNKKYSNLKWRFTTLQQNMRCTLTTTFNSCRFLKQQIYSKFPKQF